MSDISELQNWRGYAIALHPDLDGTRAEDLKARLGAPKPAPASVTRRRRTASTSVEVAAEPAE